MLKRLSLLLLTLGFVINLTAQIVSISPAFATQEDDITVTFNAALGNQGLLDVSPVYAHTGVILQGQSGWQHVQGNWGTADPNVLMTPMGNNLHEISFNITDFYGLQEGDVVEQLAFVFRNASGSQEGKTADGGDIFVDIYADEYSVTISNPLQPVILFDTPTAFPFAVAANQLSSLTLYLNDDVLNTATDVMEYEVNIDFTGMPTEQYWLWLKAENGTQTIYDSTYVILQGDPVVAASPEGIIDGINYIDDETVVLQIFAPHKDFVYAIGDFNNWEFHPDYFLNVTPEGDRFWTEISGLNPGQEYRFQYSIDQEDMRVADIYADKILDPWNDQWIPESTYPNLIEYPAGLTTEIVSVLQTAQTPFDWQVED